MHGLRIRKNIWITFPKISDASALFRWFLKRVLFLTRATGEPGHSGSSEFPAMDPPRPLGRPLQQDHNNGPDNNKKDKTDDGQVDPGISWFGI